MRTTLICSALLCANACMLQAQTDVTSQYLTNAGFDDSSSWATSDVGNGALQAVTGWTGTSTGDKWFYGGAIGYASGIQINSVTVSSDPDGATNGGALGLSAGWGCKSVYTQTVTLPADVYSLTYHYYNANSAATQANNYCGVIEADGTTHYGTTTSFTAGSWKSETVSFTLTSEQSVTFSVGMGSVSGAGSGSYAKLFIDKVVLMKNFGSSAGDWGGTGSYSAKWKGKTYTAFEKFQWANSLAVGEAMSQTMTNLAAGKYTVEILAEASSTSGRDNTNYVLTDGSTQYVSLHANDASVSIPAYNRTAFTEFDHYILTAEVGESGTLKISMNEDVAGPNWLVMKVLSCKLITIDDATTALDLDYKVGDVDCSGVVDAADVPVMAQMVLGNTSANVRSHIINQDQVTVSDLTELQNVIEGKASYPEVHRLLDDVSIRAFVHTEQSASENAADASYLLVSAKNKYAPSVNLLNYDNDWGKCFTKLNITTSLSNVKSVSVYSIDKVSIAGGAIIDVTAGTASMGDYTDNEAVTYASSTLSDVVTVTGDDAGTYTAYLLPAALPNGVIVTVRTSDGKYYSQTFTGLNIGAENNLSFTQTEASNLWMTTLPGTTYFSFLSTPGAHDACTSSVSSISSSMAKCQDTDLAGLLARGVRAFDLRPVYTSISSSNIKLDNLTIYHGIVSTGVKFKDAIDILINFVKENPSEAVSVLMQKESSSSTDQSETWRASIRECFSDTSRSPYLRGWITGGETLDDMRGKVTIVSKNPYGNSSNSYWDVVYGGIVSGWPDATYTDAAYIYYKWNQSGPKVSANDDYNSSTSDKTTNATSMLTSASGSTDKARWFYTFISIANSPASYANTMNPAIANVIGGLDGRLGYVYGDYMGSSSNGGTTIVKAVIDQNFKYVYKGRSRVNN